MKIHLNRVEQVQVQRQIELGSGVNFQRVEVIRKGFFQIVENCPRLYFQC